jgi:unsaturated rhamnogalacturonyl hydrolase
MKCLAALMVIGLIGRVGVAQGTIAQESPSRAMAASVMKMWRRGGVDTGTSWCVGYEEGVLLDGIAAEWH